MSESFAELLEQSLANKVLKPGSIVTATVLEVGPDVVIVNAGLKSEGVIPTAEFRDEKGEVSLQVGDEVEVALESLEDGFGETVLSREKARLAKQWTVFETAFENDAAVTGVMTDKVKGGFTVMLGDIRAFLPGSLVDVRPVRDASHLEGIDTQFKIIKLDRRRNNVVVSRRAVVEKQYYEERRTLMESLEEGQVKRGVVKNLTEYGAFVDLGGLDGLLHITDMAWRRVRHPSEVVNVGDEIEIKVLKFDRERVRVSLGLKQLTEDPWQAIAARYPIASQLSGSVTNVTDYGCFVEIEAGVEGLVHMSEMDWTNRNVQPGKLVQIGDQVDVMVLDIDEERRRISLGMKQCKVNPWEEFAALYRKGDRVSGKIKSTTDFGIFVELNGGIDGLVHLSDITWEEATEDAIRDFKKGDEVEAVVLLVDADRERISLGIKQLEDDPFSAFAGQHGKGARLRGKVVEVEPRQVTVQIDEQVQGTIRVSELSRDRVSDATTVVNVGDDIEALVTGVDQKSRQLQLSVRALDAKEDAVALEGYRATNTTGTTNLGELLKEKLSDSNSDR